MIVNGSVTKNERATVINDINESYRSLFINHEI